MAKNIRISETELTNIINRVINEKSRNGVLREDFEISGDEPVTKTDLNNAVKHIISVLRDEIGVGGYGDYIK